MGKVKLNEDQIEELLENEEIVFSQYWDSGSPGSGADIEAIYKYDGKYCLSLSYEDEILAYDTLDEALDAGELLSFTDAIVSIESTEIPVDELIKRLNYLGDEDHKFLINSKEYLMSENKISLLDIE